MHDDPEYEETGCSVVVSVASCEQEGHNGYERPCGQDVVYRDGWDQLCLEHTRVRLDQVTRSIQEAERRGLEVLAAVYQDQFEGLRAALQDAAAVRG
jgi:hypothetical protein